MSTAVGMTRSKARSWLLGWRTVLPIVVILLLAGGVARIEIERLENAQREQVSQSLARLRADLESRLNSRLFLVRGLSAFAKDRPAMGYGEFRAFVQRLVEQEAGIRSIQWAPGGVVTHVLPLEGNEGAIGHDLRADPARREVVERAISERRFIVSGPVALRQGGVAIVARNPVYADAAGGAPGNFLGFATIVIDMDALYGAVNLPAYEQGLRIAIRGTDGLGAAGAVFHGDAGLFADPGAERVDVGLPEGGWQMAAVLRDAAAYRWPWRNHLLAAVLLAVGLVLYFNRRTALAEAALRGNEERYRVLYESSVDALAIVDPAKGHFLDANQAAIRCLGNGRRQDLLGQSAPWAPGQLQRALAEGSATFEWARVAGDGSGGTYLVSLCPIEIDGQQQLLAICRDISASKRAEEALRLATEHLAASEARLNEAQRLAGIGSWQFDIDTDRLTWSAETFRIFALDPGQFDGRLETFLQAVHPEDRERLSNAYDNSLKARRPYELTHRLLLADGTVKYVHERCEHEFSADGQPLRSVGTVQDVTEHVLTEAAVRESEERFRTIADYTFGWEYWQGPGGEILYMSPNCQEICGYSQAEFISRPKLVEDVVHPDDLAQFQEHHRTMATEEVGRVDFRIVTKGGDIRWISHGCRAVHARDGRFLGRRASNRDVTDLKSAERLAHQLAFFDSLTGLPNRRLLQDRLAHALSQAERFRRSLAILFLDLDHFKQVNDSLGHDVGDQLLVEVGRRISGSVRAGDTVSRTGGDEFVVVLAEIAGPDDARVVAGKILEALRQPLDIAGHRLDMTTSIGIAVYPVDGSDDARELMRKADLAMYAAKQAGRNAFRIFGEARTPSAAGGEDRLQQVPDAAH